MDDGHRTPPPDTARRSGDDAPRQAGHEATRPAGHGMSADGRDGPSRPAPYFSAVLTPYRSLGRRGFLLMMGVLAAMALFATWRSLVLGAWPIALFVILDVALVYGAFRLSYRAARAFEEVHVWADELLIRQVAPNGRAVEHRFNTPWARLQVTRLEDEGVVRLMLCQQGRSVQLGAFLNPADRTSFTEAFSRALADAKSRFVAVPTAATP